MSAAGFSVSIGDPAVVMWQMTQGAFTRCCYGQHNKPASFTHDHH